MAGDEDPVRIEALRGAMAVQPGEAVADLATIASIVDRGRQIVADQRDRGAGRDQRLGDEREVLAIAALPVAAVDEGEQRRPGGRVRQEQIDRLARAVAIGEIEAARRAPRKAALVAS